MPGNEKLLESNLPSKNLTVTDWSWDGGAKSLRTCKFNDLDFEVKNGDNILEIGCGWGGFSVFAAKEYKSKIDAITISREQFEFASNKIQKEGLNEKINISFKDYRDIRKKYTNK